MTSDIEQHVVALTGNADTIAVNADNLVFDALLLTPTITQTQSTSANGAPLTISAQDAFTGSNSDGGDLILISGTKDGSGNDGKIVMPKLANTTGTYGLVTIDASGNLSSSVGFSTDINTDAYAINLNGSANTTITFLNDGGTIIFTDNGVIDAGAGSGTLNVGVNSRSVSVGGTGGANLITIGGSSETITIGGGGSTTSINNYTLNIDGSTINMGVNSNPTININGTDVIFNAVPATGFVQIGTPSISAAGGSAAINLTNLAIGVTNGPATATQSDWIPIKRSDGTIVWIPCWV